MSTRAFGLLDDLAPPPVALWRPEAIGLATAIFSTVVFLPPPPLYAISWAELWSKAANATLPVFVATALAASVASRVNAGAARWAGLNACLSMACAASWFPVVALFFRHNSPWCAALTGVLSVVGCRALLLRLRPRAAPQSLIFRAAAMAAALEFGALAAACGNWRAACVAVAAASASLTWMASGGLPRSRTATVWLVPAFLMSIPFSAGAMARYLAPGDGPAGPAAFLRALFGVSRPGGPASAQDPGKAHRAEQAGTSVARTVAIGDVYPAVILWPDVEPYTLLLPTTPALAHGIIEARTTVYSPGIPFSGFYSFRRATVLPPRNTYVTHGDPAELGFRTTDASPLIMEARQDFGRAIDVNCCRYIDLITRVAEARPGSIKLVLELHDTSSDPPDYLSFGPEPLDAHVRFRVHAAASPRQFDRIVVRFILGNARWDQSAKVAIRRFLFVP